MSPPMDDADLKRVAEAATPGPWADPWHAARGPSWGINTADPHNLHHIASVPTEQEADATYIATFDPVTVLNLLSRLSAAEARVGVLEEALTWYAKQGADCRKVTSEGEFARRSLDQDGGQIARAALTQEPSHEPE